MPVSHQGFLLYVAQVGISGLAECRRLQPGEAYPAGRRCEVLQVTFGGSRATLWVPRLSRGKARETNWCLFKLYPCSVYGSSWPEPPGLDNLSSY